PPPPARHPAPTGYSRPVRNRIGPHRSAVRPAPCGSAVSHLAAVRAVRRAGSGLIWTCPCARPRGRKPRSPPLARRRAHRAVRSMSVPLSATVRCLMDHFKQRLEWLHGPREQEAEMNILVVNSSAQGSASLSAGLARHLVEELESTGVHARVTLRDVG